MTPPSKGIPASKTYTQEKYPDIYVTRKDDVRKLPKPYQEMYLN